ncbi:MAG: hypothetical protein LBR38_02055 [Synergistaceae bacterium]|jgi:hypothetical protein|nr:hypothetical protein [Synergistaceae bacterium]
MALAKRRRWLLTLAALFSLLCAGFANANAAWAGGQDDRVKADGGLVSARSALELAAYLDYVEEESGDKAYDSRYASDHAMLTWIPIDMATGEIKALYSALQSSPDLALSFADSLTREKFNAQNPGYRVLSGDQSPVLDFKAIYKTRANNWAGGSTSYGYGMFKGNSLEASATSATSTRQLLVMAPQLLLSSQTSGYMPLFNMGNLMANFTNQQLLLTRTDFMRNFEISAQLAAYEVQDEADLQAAFEQGVVRWTEQNPSASSY